VSKDKYTENHSYRVAIYAAKIAEALELRPERIEEEMIAKGAGTDFDPKVVDAFLLAFRRGEMEVPAVVV